MSLSWRTRLLAGRVRRRLRPAPADREAPIVAYAPGRSVCDVGCMWGVNGRFAFRAEEVGATSVTGVDVMDPTTEYLAEHERRDSAVRFVQGDLHDDRVVAEVGIQDLVFCSGVLYHSPFPVATLRRLRDITGELLILQTCAVPELPGVKQGMVFYPGLADSERALYEMWGEDVRRRSIGPVTGFPDQFGPWWWGITPSALRAMLATVGFAVEEEWGDPFNLHVRARAVDRPVAGT